LIRHRIVFHKAFQWREYFYCYAFVPVWRILSKVAEKRVEAIRQAAYERGKGKPELVAGK